MFPVNTIIAWKINIYHEHGNMIITILLLPVGYISNTSLFERRVLKDVSSRRVVVLTASIAKGITRDHLDSLIVVVDGACAATGDAVDNGSHRVGGCPS